MGRLDRNSQAEIVYLLKNNTMEAEILMSKFQNLPQHAKKELLDFLDFLTSRYKKAESRGKKGFSFDWEGGLKDVNENSIELQHKANQWRNT
jgi:hypothetical protein